MEPDRSQPPSACVLAFRGHQDQCFGLKLLFDRDTFDGLSSEQRRALFTGNGMYKDGPYWWRQVLELAGIPYREVPGTTATWEIDLDARFMARVIPIFTLTSAVAGRRLRYNSYCVLDLPAQTLRVHELDLMRATARRPPDFSAGGRRKALQRAGLDPLHAFSDTPQPRMGASFAKPAGDLVGRFGYLTQTHPAPRWDRRPTVHRHTTLDREIGGGARTPGVVQPLYADTTIPEGGGGEALSSPRQALRLLRDDRAWSRGNVLHLLQLLRRIRKYLNRHKARLPACDGATFRALWTRREREIAQNPQRINVDNFRQRLRLMSAELLEYAGGDQLTNSGRRHMNGEVFDGVVTPSYAAQMLEEVKEGIFCLWAHNRMWWKGRYRNTADSAKRILRQTRPDVHKVVVVGDVHGSFHALLRDLCDMRRQGLLSEDFRIKPSVMLVFLGDYVDYGPYGMEVLWTLLWLRCLNPHSCVLIGGNHEDVLQNTVRGGGSPDNFQKEVQLRFKQHTNWRLLQPHLQRLYATLPRALVLLTKDTELHFSHGCGSPVLHHPKASTSPVLAEQIAWADMHQHHGTAPSSRGGDVLTYGTDELQQHARCVR